MKGRLDKRRERKDCIVWRKGIEITKKRGK